MQTYTICEVRVAGGGLGSTSEARHSVDEALNGNNRSVTSPRAPRARAGLKKNEEWS